MISNYGEIQLKVNIKLIVGYSLLQFNSIISIFLESLLTLSPNLVRLSEDSVLQSSLDIQLTRDCGEDLICHPLIEIILTPLDR